VPAVFSIKKKTRMITRWCECWKRWVFRDKRIVLITMFAISNHTAIRRMYDRNYGRERKHSGWYRWGRKPSSLLALRTQADPTWRMIDDENIQRVNDLCEREIEIYWYEKELAEHELEFVRCEIAMLCTNGHEGTNKQ